MNKKFELLREAVGTYRANHCDGDKNSKELLDFINELEQLTTLIISNSLPSDSEIEDQSEQALFGFGKGRIGDDIYAFGYEEGAKWMKNKINESQLLTINNKQ